MSDVAVTANGLPVLAALLAPRRTLIQTPAILTWPNPASIVYGTPLSGTQLDATANVPGTFVYSPPLLTILHAGAGQTLSVGFTPTDTTDYTAAIATVTIDVTQATPTLTWANPASIVYGAPLSVTQLDASASVPGIFYYWPRGGTTLHVGKAQTLSVTFRPSDETGYASATATVIIDVTQATPTIKWPYPPGFVYGTALSADQLNATANVPGTFTTEPLVGTILYPGKHGLAKIFYPEDSKNYQWTFATVEITVKAPIPTTPNIIWANAADITVGTPLSWTQFQIRTSPVVVSTVSTSPPWGTILPVGDNQPITITITPEDKWDYTSASVTVHINVKKPPPLLVPTITWTNPSDITVGTRLSSLQLDATSYVVGTFTYTPALGTLLKVGAGQTLEVSFVPLGTQYYSKATAHVHINVVKATPTPFLVGAISLSPSKQGATAILFGFNEPMVRRSVVNLAQYQVLGGSANKGKTVYTKVLPIKGIGFDGKTRVTLKFAQPYKGPVKLTVRGGILAVNGALSQGDFTTVVARTQGCRNSSSPFRRGD